MPILGVAIQKVLELTVHLGDVPYEDYVQYHPYGIIQYEPIAEEICAVYGITRRDIDEIESRINLITTLPAAIDHPVLLKCVAIDYDMAPNEYEITDLPHDENAGDKLEAYYNYTIESPKWSPFHIVAAAGFEEFCLSGLQFFLRQQGIAGSAYIAPTGVACFEYSCHRSLWAFGAHWLLAAVREKNPYGALLAHVCHNLIIEWMWH